MRELLKEELSEAKKNVEQYEEELKVLLLPKDPNDDKNVIVEIRAGAGGDEAALFAAEIYRMYKNYAESKRWKTEFIDVNENGIGGFKEVSFMINGQGAYPCNRVRRTYPYFYNHSSNHARSRRSRCTA